MELNHEGPPLDDEPRAATLSDYLQTDRFKSHLAASLPKHMDTERFASIALRQLSSTPELQECTLASVIGGMMTAALLGLEIGVQGECWLLPFWNTRPKDGGPKRREAQLQIGVWGHVALAQRHPRIADIQIDVAMKGEPWQYQKGTSGYLDHIPGKERDYDDVGSFEWVYACVRTDNGGRYFDAFPMSWVERVRSQSQSPNSPAWTNWYAEQSMAKALKRTLKVCPKSREMARAITLDDEADAGVRQTWEVDTSLLLPSEVALDPATQKAREAMSEMGASPGREPELEERQRPQQPQQREAPTDDGSNRGREEPAEPQGGGGLGWD